MTLHGNCRTLRTAATLGLLLLAVCCKKREEPRVDPVAPGASSATHATVPLGSARPADALNVWTDCVGGLVEPNPVHDPGGQGQRILGVGFIPPGYARLPRPFRFFAQIDRFHDATKDGVPITDIHVKDHALTGTIARGATTEILQGDGWRGVSLTGTLRCVKKTGAEIPISARIQGARRQPARPAGARSRYALNGAWLYDLQIELQEVGSSWRPACNGEDDVVVAVAGYFERDGTYNPDPTQLSFACMKRDAARCEDAGYLADDSTDTTGEKRKLFNACTRMTTADYCGKGGSLTRDGSKIDTWDNRKVETEDTQAVTNFHFEAAWTSDGAVCIDHLRWALKDVGLPPLVMAGCLSALPKCGSAGDATTRAAGKALVFNKSCTQHPCGDEKLEGSPNLDPGPL